MSEKTRWMLQINNDFDMIYIGKDGQPGVLTQIETIVQKCRGHRIAIKHEICRIMMKHSAVSFDLRQQHRITWQFIITHFGEFLKQTLDGQPFGTGPVNTDNHVVVRQILDNLILIYQEVKQMYDDLVRNTTTYPPQVVSNTKLSLKDIVNTEPNELMEYRARENAARDARASIDRGRAHAGAGAASSQPSFQQPSTFSQAGFQQLSPFSQPVFQQRSARHFPTPAMQQQMESAQIRDHFEERRRNIQDQHRLAAHPRVAGFLDSIFIDSDDDYESFDATPTDPFAVANYPNFALKHDIASADFDEQYALRLAVERMRYRDPNAQNFEPATSMQY